MIVCSKCQFENPVHNRYCQQCGELLVQVPMSEDVSPDATDASRHDGVTDAAVRNDRDTVTQAPSQSTSAANGDDYEAEDLLLALLVPAPLWEQRPQQQPLYLDRNQRYRIVQPSAQPGGDDEIWVVDTQSDQRPYLEQAQSPEDHPSLRPGTREGSPVDTPGAVETVATDFTVPLVEMDGSIWSRVDWSPTGQKLAGSDSFGNIVTPEINNDAPNVSWPLVSPMSQPLPTPISGSTVPDVEVVNHQDLAGKAIAPQECVAAVSTQQVNIIQIYLELQEQLFPSFPRLVDGWKNEGTVVLVENRASLALLKDVIHQTTVVAPQVLHWCHEMTELWAVLQAHGCCRSLLVSGNLRVDEDQILCLKRLYFDEHQSQCTIKDLGALWRTLFEPASWQCPDALVQIHQNLESGNISDLETLRIQLEAAADQIHQSALDAQSLSSLDSDSFVEKGSGHEDRLNNGECRDEDVTNPQAEADWDPPAPGERSPQPTTPLDSESDLPSFSEDDREAQESSSSMVGTGLGDDPTVVLPMQLYTLSNAGTTNVGIQRDHNEDFFTMDTHIHTADTPAGRVCQAKGLYVLCDGMGGHAAGEVASLSAGTTLKGYFQEHWGNDLPDEEMIRDSIILANQDIYEQNQANASEGSRRMGTTLVMLVLQDTKAAIAHVGDSRIYRFTRRQGLEQLTVDHEVGQREMARGVAPDVAYARPDAYQLTQALGPRDQDFIRPDIQFIDMNEDSLFVLGSDGLTDNELLETYCESHIEPLISTNANLDEGAYNLIELANQVNGHDNITVLLVRVKLRPKLSLLTR